MANCGRPTCHKCPTPPRCPRGIKCPRCQNQPGRRPLTKFELDLKRIKGKK